MHHDGGSEILASPFKTGSGFCLLETEVCGCLTKYEPREPREVSKEVVGKKKNGERKTERQTDRQTDRQTETDRQTDRQTDRDRETETERETEREGGRD